MGKRSGFERRPRDFYPTPVEAVRPLLAHLLPGTRFAEPCAGDGALIRHLEAAGHKCAYAADIEPRADGITPADAREATMHALGLSWEKIITNPPWERELLHALIVRLSDIGQTWLLFDADWSHTKQAAPYLSRLRKIVSVGRIKWIPDSPFTGKDNCAWHLFDKPATEPVQFYGRAA